MFDCDSPLRSSHALSRVFLVFVVAVFGLGAVPTTSAASASVATPAQLVGTPEVEDVELGDIDSSSGVLDFESDLGFEMVGLRWDEGAVTTEIRSQSGGVWTEWVEMEPLTGAGDDDVKAETEVVNGSGPGWLAANQDSLQVRVVEGSATNAILQLIDSEPSQAETYGLRLSSLSDSSSAPGTAKTVDPLQPSIVLRGSWGANESYKQCSTSIATRLDRAAIHHTVSTNNYTPAQAASIIRGIYYYHTQTLKWCDIGYNFLVDQYGTIYEGRSGGIDRPVIGAHSSGFNTYAVGIAAVGDFGGRAVPANVTRSISLVIGWKFSLHGISATGTHVATSGGGSSARYSSGTRVTLPNIVGHRNTSYTECPGNSLYSQLGQIRNIVAFYLAVIDPVDRVICDWDGDGVDSPAVFQAGKWWISNDTGSGVTKTVNFGRAGDQPLCGDWNGDGKDSLGVKRGNLYYLRPYLESRSTPFSWGKSTDNPIVGDWDGDGDDTLGIVRAGGGAQWFLKNSHVGKTSTMKYGWGRGSDKFISGDWDGNGSDSVGLVRGKTYYLSNKSVNPASAYKFSFGVSTDEPVAGSWTSNDRDTIGRVRGGFWYLRNSNSSGSSNRVFGF